GVVTDGPFVVGLYLRVSTNQQVEGESLKEQEDELSKYCQFKGYRIHKSTRKKPNPVAPPTALNTNN
ncbi:hypothetical protein EBR57_06315, partial [bacterium]|nr:hypothetical protein [bacterium]